MILSIDPGLNGCGVARWRYGILKLASYIRNPGTTWLDMAKAIVEDVTAPFDEIAIELPQVYVQSRWKGDQNDLINLAGLVGAIVGHIGKPSTLYRPAEWKGQVPKDVMQRRIAGKLHEKEAEVVVLPPKTLQHNVWDAVGIGLHHLRRL